ncbi:amino acid ABC transporter permease [Paracoccus jiaweipingae]|uniref:amino acid ABC transporter permease n=1 Tax=unclassified Paracoccus (in: a-proteobacteria) TaxID=2688777 RepID=UPI00378C1F98
MSEIHAQTVPFLRETMLPPAPPPARQAGAVRWLRENLFSGPLNTVLTVLGVLIVWSLLRTAWPWLSHSVWHADSLRECRSIIAASFGEGTTGACWAMLRERWNQFTFGFYPPALYWRPVLAFALLFVALTPVLFSERAANRRIILAISGGLGLALSWGFGAPVPALALLAAVLVLAVALSETGVGRMLVLTALYPAVAYWLLWGGSIWGPLLTVLGFGIGYGLLRLLANRAFILAVVVAVLATVLWWLYAVAPIARDLGNLMPLGLARVTSDQFGGFLLSITIGVAGIAMSLPLGIILALARRSDMPLVKMFAVMFIEFIRGVPLIALLFVASLLLNYFLPPGTSFDIILRVVIMVTLFAAAYMAEVIRGGLAALPKGQYEAADALGLDYWKAQRLIILPQALKISIPGIVSTFIGMFKDTTLVTFVGLYDPLKAMSDTVRASIEWKGIYWEPYIFVGVVFFILCFGMSRYSMFLERRLKRDHH